MKRTVFLVAALLALMAVSVFAQTEADFTVRNSTDGKSTRITKYNGSATVVKIPEKINNLPVTEINGFSMQSNITSVTIPNSVTTIGENAFGMCWGITSIIIPDSVTKIARNAFNDCRGLTSITIGKGIKTIEEDAFNDCTNLTSVTFLNGFNMAGFNEYAFGELGDLRKKFFASSPFIGTAGTYTRPDGGTTWTKK